MKLIWTLLFLILTSKNYSQDSLIAISKLPWISIKAMPFPLTYGITFGYGYLGMIEKRIAKKQSICVGTKFMRVMGAWESKNRLMLFEYRYYFKSYKEEANYLSPYLKLRDLYYYHYEGGGINQSYNENSLGLGLTYGHTIYLDKKNGLELNAFVGGGYFFNLESEGTRRFNGSNYIEFNPEPIYTRFDLRFGVLLGFNFH